MTEPGKPSEKQLDIIDVELDASKLADFDKSFAKSFTVTWTNPETGHVKVGTFTARRPSLGKLGQIAVYKAKLNGGEQVDPMADFYHSMMADLQFILVDFPDWWKPADFFDARPLREVWEHVSAWLNSFRSKRVG